VRRPHTLRVGVIGYGYWGPNVVRNFHNTPNAVVASVCDVNAKSLDRVRRSYPSIAVTTDPLDVLRSPAIDAVAIVTPISHHFSLAQLALENGKHIFVEKPFTRSVSEAEQLIELADRKKLIIMVDHTFLFNGAVRKIRQLIDTGVLGTLYYYDSTRVNLGIFQHDANVVWDLAPHDLSIMDYLIEADPQAIVATGEKHVNGVENIAFITIFFTDKVIAHLNVNWLSPVKVRTTLIGGEKKMLVWNDLEADEKVKIYDKGVERSNGDQDLRVSYRAGDLWVPRIEHVEALTLETQYFVDCVLKNRTPFNDGRAGLRVVQMLEAVDQSMSKMGDVVYCDPASKMLASEITLSAPSLKDSLSPEAFSDINPTPSPRNQKRAHAQAH
jgi:predicted dehydrogenase